MDSNPLKDGPNPIVVVSEIGDAEEYFSSYEDMDVHRIMLQDEARTNAYKEAIYKAKSLFSGKVVMDVGAGTGILSLFCASAGAKVIAVEASNLAKLLPKVAEANGFKDVIQVIHSKVEDIQENFAVDIIVSEWMGFYLLHESMLESVIFAREKFLKPGGLMFPNSAEIFAAPCTIPELWANYHDFWVQKQYDFDLSCFSNSAKLRLKPEISLVPTEQLLSDPQSLWKFDLNKVTIADIQELQDRRFFSIEEDGEMQGVVLWFTCGFPAVDGEEETTLSTAPWDPATHWKQTVVVLPEQTTFEAGDITGWQFRVEKTEPSEEGVTNRSYRIHLEFLDGTTAEHPVPCLCGSVKCELVRHFLQTHPAETKDSSTADAVGAPVPTKEDIP